MPFHPGKDEPLDCPGGLGVSEFNVVAFAPSDVSRMEERDSVGKVKAPPDVLLGKKVMDIDPVGNIDTVPCPPPLEGPVPNVVEFHGALSPPVDVRVDVGAGAGAGVPVTRDTANEEELAVAVLFDT